MIRHIYCVGLRLQRGIQAGQDVLGLLQVGAVNVDEGKVHALLAAELCGCETDTGGRARDEGGCLGTQNRQHF